MRRNEAIVLVALLVGLEAAGTFALLWGAPARQVTGFILGHGAASALAMALWPLLPPEYRTGQARAGALLLALLVLLMPVFGLLGLLLVVLPALYKPVCQRPCTWRRVSIDELPVRPDAPAAERSPVAGGRSLIDVLQSNASMSERVAAVLAVRHLPTRAAVPILRLALRDPADDVRLLAYAMLDRRDAVLEGRIQALEVELARGRLAPEDERAVHRTLARLHWELSYCGLATGAIEERALDSARDHARAALALDRTAAPKHDHAHAHVPDQEPAHTPDRGTLFLLGRILLRQGALREAEQALLEARELGIAESSIRPFLAEIAFIERRFTHVRAHLQAGGRGGDLRPGLVSHLGNFWLPEAV